MEFGYDSDKRCLLCIPWNTGGNLYYEYDQYHDSQCSCQKKEIGMLQAVGGSSAAGYPVFLWARNSGMFNVRNYHYPLAATLIMIAVLAFVQVILVFVIGKSVKKDSLIDRIRFDS